MFMNLFSSFDPSTSNYFSFNWLSLCTPLFFMPMILYINKSRISMIFFQIQNYLFNELNKNIKKQEYNNLLIFIIFFWMIFVCNFLGLFPYIFTPTTHLPVSLALSLTNWLTFMIFGWINSFKNMMCHLVPLGTPIYLASFMVIIETISNLIRPITLSVRLTANLIAGHLLMTLLSGISEKMSFMYMLTMPVLVTLLCLEMAVSVIQSYVFMTLISLYFNEI